MSVILQAIASHGRDHGDRTALADSVSTCTYAELPGKVRERARQLVDAKVTVLAVCTDNCVDWVLWDLAAMEAGVVCVPIPPFFSEGQTRHVYRTAGIDATVDHDGLQSHKQDPVGGTRSAVPAGTAKITYTSGTTGEPKGVCLSQKGIDKVAGSIVEVLGTEYAGNHVAVLPLAVLLENVAGVYSALLAGSRIDLPPCRDTNTQPAALLRVLAERNATTAILVPQLLRGLIAAMEAGGSYLPGLRYLAVGGAKVSPQLLGEARALGLPVYEGYGLSECGSVVALNTPQHERPGTVGKVLPHVDLHIEQGEIVVRDPVALGYLGEPPFTRFASGDLGVLDADGYLSVHGRKKDVLITSYGRNISPEWVEAALLDRPEIAQALVCGDAQSELSALLVPANTQCSDSAIAEAVATANQTLPEYAQIKRWHRVPPFSASNGFMTGNGRIRRQAILDHYAQILEIPMNQQNFYERLLHATEPERGELYGVPQLSEAMRGNISRETYIAYLTQAYHHVKHTVRFLMAMGARLPAGKEWLHDAIADYIQEEKGHEQWILDDIEAAGGDREKARSSLPHLETQVLVAYNYDYIARHNPIGFLGMVFMLESTSVQIAVRGARSVQDALGLPDEAFTYLFSHGELDQKHMRTFEELVNRLDDVQDQSAIIEVAKNTFRLFANVLRSIPQSEVVKNVA